MNDGATPGGWLRIGEVARRTGLTVRALHHYDRLGLLVPSERSWGDHRLYTPSDLRRLLDIQHLNKAFGSIPVLRDLNLTVNGPLVLMGPSGCGKTTLLRILMGLETPDSGTVQGVGNIGAVFQESRLCPQLTAVGNICLVGGVNPAQAQAELQTLGFTQAELALPVARLSGGQKRNRRISLPVS